MKKHFTAFVLGFLLLLLSSCSQLIQLPDQYDWRVSGKFALKTATENEQSRFIWTQYADTWHLQLNSSLGNKILDVVGKPDFIQLKALGKKPVSSKQPEQFLHEQTGMLLPLNDLSFWLQGYSSPHTTVELIEKNERQLIQKLNQSGWQLEFLSYKNLRPKKIRLYKNDVQLTIVNKVWE